MSLKGKTVALTGGAAGIGAAVRETLLTWGAEVVVLDRTDPQDERVKFIAVDLSDPDSIENAIAQLPTELDGLANVAGVPGTQSPELVMRVNYLGLRALTEHVIDRIRSGGAVVNVASIAGASWMLHLEKLAELVTIEDYDTALKWSVANAPARGADAYEFSKEAVLYYTKWRSHSAWQKGVRMNAVCPGATATGILEDFKESMAPGAIDWSEQLLGRHGKPEDVAPIVVFLLDSVSGFINGADIPVDGGLVAGLTVGAISQVEQPSHRSPKSRTGVDDF